MNAIFFLNAALFGVALAMDAFSVSCANGLNEPKMRLRKVMLIAGTFAAFQVAMPLIGWFCVSTVASFFEKFQKFIPWIALLLLGFLGGKMLFEGLRHKEGDEETPAVGFGGLIIQGIATSIDALSVGFTIAELNVTEALVEAGIIGVVTFGICVGGVYIGKKFGTKLAGKATVLGGVILIAIGIEIFVKSFFS